MSHKTRLKLELWISAIMLIFFAVTAVLGTRELAEIFLYKLQSQPGLALAKQIAFTILVASLLYGGLVYQMCRIGFLWRRLKHVPMPQSATDSFFRDTAPAVTVLIPSYKEETRVIWQTLFSACLQEYPNKNVVLLIDNPPNTRRDDDRILLEQARQIPLKMNYLFAEIHNEISAAWWNAQDRLEDHDRGIDFAREFKTLASMYDRAARWIQSCSNQYNLSDHTDRFFAEHVLIRTLRRLEARGQQIADMAPTRDPNLLMLNYERLLGLFAVNVTSFERKQFQNLSHEPNKAMNLNSYLSLIGKIWKTEHRTDGNHLVEVRSGDPLGDQAFCVRPVKYCVTLDADSVLLPDYVQTLVQQMEQPNNKDLAVIQTPYSAFPRSTSALEKIAGATTDIQYLIHQGFTFFNSTFWVGANAVLRHQALLDIAEPVQERGHTVMRFIHDHTVIEDTESTIDLVAKGWRLQNYPERLSYSATPPDFGALLIQRRRWANGGLLIFPKLFRNFFKVGPIEMFVRSHYLLSIAMVNFALIIMLTYSFDDCARSIILPLTALPYYFLYGRDLRLNGYRFRDLFDVYALNLVLIPVNLGGVIKSIHQGLTGVHTPFARTPKVSGRTTAPRMYVAFECALTVSWLVAGIYFVTQGANAVGGFTIAHSLLLGYGVFRFIGLKAMREDLFPAAQTRPFDNVVPLPTKAATKSEKKAA